MQEKEHLGAGDIGGDEATNALSTSQAVLQYFWDMASFDEDVRVAAARGIVADLTADQAKHAGALGKDAEIPPEDGAPRIRQLEYHLRRCSPTMLAAERRSQCLEQLLTALRFPAAAELESDAALHFLALHAFAEVKPAKASKSKLPEVQRAAQLATPLSLATRTACAARLVGLLTHLGHSAQAKMRTAHQQQNQQQQPAAKKQKTGAAAAAPAAAATPAPAAPPPPPSAVHQPLHDTLSYIRKALKAPGVSPARELGEDGTNGLQLLAAVEAAALERLAALETTAVQQQQQQQGAVQQGGRLRALAALAAHLQLHLLADPETFEMDLPISLRRLAAEGMGLSGLPEVEEEEEEEAEAEGGKEGKEGGERQKAGAWGDLLVDVLLALMARPGGSVPIAPLREAAETLWRQCCDQLSGEGLADIVRVVAAGGKGEGQDEAALFESDDEDEEEAEEEGSEEGSEDGSEEEGSEADEEEGAPKGKEAGKKRKGAAMDDEAMFRMDSKLAAYFKSISGGRAGGAAAVERAAALMNFRLRALALLEVFAKKVGLRAGAGPRRGAKAPAQVRWQPVREARARTGR
ncbi:hypothetical protein TSOC_002263 [Tetrabaena socialis]|uniref:Uncharacterized protein n=1 Tax=Tetrabaena socialis TaxID=47790 RepID=A0A2J8AEM0_9CHLO|nr:hypothetical protein TSOC_002263 [Tetrabaena socialis]|eukprot:PNH10963.1 hypothetical protein TSOC_002263 [Tetrabaena socialis]